MNKIYKVIWSKVKGCYVVASEIAKRNGKSSTGSRHVLLGAVMAAALLTPGMGMNAEAALVINSDHGGTLHVYPYSGDVHLYNYYNPGNHEAPDGSSGESGGGTSVHKTCIVRNQYRG